MVTRIDPNAFIIYLYNRDRVNVKIKKSKVTQWNCKFLHAKIFSQSSIEVKQHLAREGFV